MADGKPVLLTYSQALQRVAELPIAATHETIPLIQAQGRVLFEDVCLAGDQPPFDRATMDGFAVVLDGPRTTFAVLGLVPAGTSFGGTLTPGEGVRIMTGAPAPAGTTVIPLEATDQAGRLAPRHGMTHKTISSASAVTIVEPSALQPRRNIAFRGEDGHAGAVVVPAGTILGPATLACAAMAGARDLAVMRQPQLALVTTGDEVGGSGAAAINDSNGPFLTAFADALGLGTTRVHVADDAVALRAAIVSAFDHADVVVTTGGVSAGDKDLIPVLAPSLGMTVIFHHVAMQPGKPVFLARRGDGKLLLGLPGNPVSVLATAHLILLPIIRRFLGLPAEDAWQHLPLAIPWEHRGKRQLFLPAKRTAHGVAPIQWNGSGDLIAAAAGDCLIDLPPGAVYAAGIPVAVLPYVGTQSSTKTSGTTGVLPDRR